MQDTVRHKYEYGIPQYLRGEPSVTYGQNSIVLTFL